MDTTGLFEWKYILASLLYSGIGILVLVLAFVLLDLFTPKVPVWKELVEKQNMAMAIFLGAVALGISIIIASAIHG